MPAGITEYSVHTVFPDCVSRLAPAYRSGERCVNGRHPMPVRLLREGILDSDKVERLSYHAEVFYRRLMSVVDDFGRYDARPTILRTRLFPLRVDRVSEKDIAEWLRECIAVGLVQTYESDGKSYLVYLNLKDGRAMKSKYPEPPINICLQMKAYESRCTQLLSDVTYSDSDSDSDSTKSSPEPEEPASGPISTQLPPEIPVVEIPCVGNGPKVWPVTASKVYEWAESYPGIDIVAECRKARQWCIDNPTKRKTYRGVSKFLSGWLSRSQDRHQSTGTNNGYKSRGEAQDLYTARQGALAMKTEPEIPL